MYQILNRAGEVLAETDAPRYIKQRKNGVWHHCDKDDATAIAIDGQRYELADIFINPLDAAEKIKSVALDGIKNAESIEEVKAYYTDLAEAMVDLIMWRYQDEIAALEQEAEQAEQIE